MVKKCPLCGSTEIHLLLKPYRGGWIYVCKACLNAFTFPLPEVSYINDSFFDIPRDEYDVYRDYASRIIKFISMHFPGGTLLDIGTGGGFLLEEAQKQGFKPYGIDSSGPAVAFCQKRNLRVFQGYFEKYDFKKRKFKIITCSHVLEHVPDPEKFITKLKKLMDKNSCLFLAQTNFQGTVPRLFGRFWEGWVPQEHRIHFSPQGITHFLSGHDMSVKVMSVIPLGYSLKWRRGKWPVMKGNIYNALNYLISKLKIGFPFIGDQMYVLAEKQ